MNGVFGIALAQPLVQCNMMSHQGLGLNLDDGEWYEYVCCLPFN